MKLSDLMESAHRLGCVTVVKTFDGGQSVSLSHGAGASMVTWRGSFQWGDEDQTFEAIGRWLSELPISEDDPRVQHEGVHISGY